MIKAKVGFIVYGVHKDGLQDPMGTPFIDDKLVANAKKALTQAGLELVEHNIVIASKAEAKECLAKFKKADDIDAVILFSGTWVWLRTWSRQLEILQIPERALSSGLIQAVRVGGRWGGL